MLKVTLLVCCIFLRYQSDATNEADTCTNGCHGRENEAAQKYDNPFKGFENGDPQNCPQLSKSTFKIGEVLPGYGWDNLQNEAMGQVIAHNYSKCKIFADRSFLLPNDIRAVALKQSNVETYSQLITHFSNYTSVTSYSINEKGHGTISGIVKISGSFDMDYRRTKMKIAGDKSSVNRVQLRYELYRMLSDPDPQLHPTFKNRILDIGAYAQSDDNSSATYLSQLLIRDYVTHVVTRIKAGAAVVRTVHLNSSYTNDMSSSSKTITLSGKASFLKFVGGAKSTYSYSVSESDIERYRQSAIDSETVSYGGPPVKANFSLDEFVDEMPNNLVATDQDGDPLDFIITTRSVPELPMDTVHKVGDFVREAIKTYYMNNLYPGCTNVNSENFNYISNFEDGSCQSPHNNYTFGGVYQTCTGGLCGRTQVNPKTGGYSCPENYATILVDQHTDHNCYRRKHHHHWICEYTNNSPNAAHYELHWCVNKREVSDQSGYLFGGVYTPYTNNLVTGKQSCPPFYTTLTVGWNPKLYICISDDYELAYRYSVKFAGFFSCKSGNPLAVVKEKKKKASLHLENHGYMTLAAYHATKHVYPKKCPKGYSQHLWIVNGGCEVNYCVVVNGLSPWALPEIRRPPFMDHPKMSTNESDILISANGGMMGRNHLTGQWNILLIKSGEPTDGTVSSNRQSGSSANGPATTVLGILGTVAIMVVLILAAYFLIKRARRRTYNYINSSDSTESTGHNPVYNSTISDVST